MPTLSIEGWARYQKDLAKNFWPAVRRGLQAGGERAVAIAQQAVVEAPPASANGSRGAFDTGGYRRMWKKALVANGSGAFGVRIYNQHPAAGVIEHGRRPGAKAPPSSAIEAWVRRKLHVTKSEAKSVAFAVSQAIGRRGLRPRRVLEGAVPKMQAAIEKEISTQLERALRGGQ